jgi:putative aldouronate transport system substrate-binding protein
MNRFSKRVTALLLIATLVFVSIIGCSNNKAEQDQNTKNNTSNNTAANTAEADNWQQATAGSGGQALPVTKESVEYSFMTLEFGNTPIRSSFVVVPEVERRTNVKFDLQKVPESNYKDKLNVVLASGDIPDLVAGVSLSVANEFGPKGLFLNIWDYIDIMPNLKKAFDTFPEFAEYKYSDNQLYQLMNQCAPNSDPQGFGYYKQIPMIRTDVLEDLNLKAPATFDELYEVLSAIKSKYPDSYPWINQRGLEFLQQVLVAWNGKVLEQGYNYAAYDPDSKKWGFAPEQAGFKEMIEYLRKLYAEGLLDKEFAVANSSQWEERSINDKGFFSYSYWNSSDAITLKARESGKEQFKTIGIVPPANTGPSAVVVRNSCSNFSAINSKVKNPEALLKALDYWLYSVDGTMLANAGIEGTNFVWEEDQKIYKLVDPDLANPTNETHKEKFGVRYEYMTGLRPDHFDIHNHLVDPDNNIYHQQYLMYQGHTVNPGPVKIFKDTEKAETMKQVGVPIKDFVEQQLTKFITGASSMDTWDQFIQTVNS